jgi:hypothetical protein
MHVSRLPDSRLSQHVLHPQSLQIAARSSMTFTGSNGSSLLIISSHARGYRFVALYRTITARHGLLISFQCLFLRLNSTLVTFSLHQYLRKLCDRRHFAMVESTLVSDLRSLEIRLQRMERSFKLLLCSFLVLLCFFASVILRSKSVQAATPETLRVRRLIVLDDKGNERIVIAAPIPDPVVDGKTVKR